MNDTELINILSSQNYLTPSRYISGRIVEYDIKSANISTLREFNIISEEEYNRLSNIPKLQREIEIGLMEKNDPSIYTNIQKGIKSAKLALGKANNISPDSIIRIANDAVYINSNIDLKYKNFGKYIEFKQKSEYNIMLQLNKIIIFLKFLSNGSVDIDVKGINEEKIKFHHEYMINTIASIIVILERSGTLQAINYLSSFCEDYLHYNLPVGFYREFNSDSIFRLKYYIPGDKSTDTYESGFNLGVTEIAKKDISSLDINYNYSILRELWSILIEFYNLGR